MDTPLTEAEIHAWVAGLGRTPAQQIAEIRHLLLHANEDEMSVDDRAICQRELARLVNMRAQAHGKRDAQASAIRR